MSEAENPDIVILEQRIDPAELRRLVDRFFGDMVKYVVDIERERAAIGGELHADAEALLLQNGSQQEHLWGANYYPGRGPEEAIELTALVNIRPAQDNRSMEIQSPQVRGRIKDLTHLLIGKGEPL